MSPARRGQAQELLVPAELIELVVRSAQQRESVQTAPVRGTGARPRSLSTSPGLLEATPVLDARVEDLESLRLAASNAARPNR